jgi:histidinol-phosphate/aromatic aminotransferase/cobyric acid decarboxylase-like protein/GNAT superfamily N-acetyltransferase
MQRLTVRMASAADREIIYGLRHQVYAIELQQYPPTELQQLSDPVDAYNTYIVALVDDTDIGGFISITPPNHEFRIFSHVDKRLFHVDETTCEIRLLTVMPEYRHLDIAKVLCYAAAKFVESLGCTDVILSARDALLPVYEKFGCKKLYNRGLSFKSGAVTYHVMTLSLMSLPNMTGIEWVKTLGNGGGDEWVKVRGKPKVCYHGGAAFEDHDFRNMPPGIIVADVLDAWFDPGPKVLEALGDMARLSRSSPVTHAHNVYAALAKGRDVPVECLLLGAGSSDLMYRCLPLWLNDSSKALVYEPSYGEYAHICHKLGCQVTACKSWDAYWEAAYSGTYDMVFLVNPNNPTGCFLEADTLIAQLQNVPMTTKVWVDESYMEFHDRTQSVERICAQAPHVVVCKSLSKIYALSGLRAAYLCGSHKLLGRPRAMTPPWVLSMPAQVAVLAALADEASYYAGKWEETRALRNEMVQQFTTKGISVQASGGNFVVIKTSNAGDVVNACRMRGLYIRYLTDTSLRVAVTTHPKQVVDIVCSVYQ